VSHFLASGLRNRPWRAGTLALGILAAAVSFVLLTGSARTSSLQVRGTLKENFRGAYDILVRPNRSFTPLERRRGLIRDNYLSGIYGGITLRQYRAIQGLPGVEVAAPIANLGTTFLQGTVTVPLRRFLGPAQDQLFRVRFSWSSQRSLSSYPGADQYFYATRRPFQPGPGMTSVVSDPLTGRLDQVCDGYDDTRPIVYRPFVPLNSTLFWCAGSNRAGVLGLNLFKPYSFKRAAVYFDFMLPVNVAAVDPAAEDRLLGLRSAVASGRYLSGSDRPRVATYSDGLWLNIPVLAASRSFVDEQLQAAIERLVVPRDTDVPGMLGAGACGANSDPAQSHCGVIPGSTTSTPIQPGPPGHRHTTAYRFVTSLRGVRIGETTFSAQHVYTGALRQRPWLLAYWRGAPVRYRQIGPATLRPIQVSNGQATWVDTFTTDTGYFDQPTDNLDSQFRRLSETTGRNTSLGSGGPGSEARIPLLKAVGRFDPRRLRGFSPLSRVPLETYYPPSLEPADARTRALLHGNPLLPSQNVGDYEQQPPLLLTNLNGLAPLLSVERFYNLSPRQQRAPISVVRIRVKGVTGPNSLSETRIRTVAQLIHDRTGLDVDITAGSSPTPITIELPAGKFGRPALSLREGWVQKGVSVSYLRALDRKDLGLFALVLVVCCFFLANGALAAVRARRAEIGTLRTLGWPGRAIFAVVLGELLLVGLAAGLVGAGLAALLVRALALDFPMARVLYVLPLALGLTLLAGLVPAWGATRPEPLETLRPPVAPGRRGRARGVGTLALLNLQRLPLRTALGAGGLALGVAALTILLAIERAFQGSLVGTVLGSAVTVQVHRADLVAAALTLGLAALAVADVLYLNLRERAPELAALRTTGWAEAQIVRLVLLEALGLGLLGSLAGLAVGLLLGTLVLGVPAGPLLLAALIAAAAGTAAAIAAASVPTAQALRAQPSAVLATET
jgi:putative ABC transport system permease protein